MTAYQPFHVSIKDAAAILGVCRQTLYRMHRAGELKLSKVRRRTFVPVAELERIRVASQEPRSDDDKLDRVGEPVGEPVSRRPAKRKLYPMVR